MRMTAAALDRLIDEETSSLFCVFVYDEDQDKSSACNDSIYVAIRISLIGVIEVNLVFPIGERLLSRLNTMVAACRKTVRSMLQDPDLIPSDQEILTHSKSDIGQNFYEPAILPRHRLHNVRDR